MNPLRDWGVTKTNKKCLVILVTMGVVFQGVLILEKGTDCYPTAEEMWLLRADMAKK